MRSGDRSRLSHEVLESLLEFESLVSDLSSRFINLPPDEVDREIRGALRRVCEFLGLDLAVLWQWTSAVPYVIAATHFHYSEEGQQPPGPAKVRRFAQTPFAVAKDFAV